MSFVNELKRRNVIRVAVAYLVVSWVVLQIADVVFPALKLPEWSITLVTVLLALGFVVALVFSWAFELTPDGLKKDDGGPANPHAHRKLDLITIGAVVVVLALIGYQQLGGSGDERRAAGSEQIAADGGDGTGGSDTPYRDGEDAHELPSVAVLPFTNMSADVENEYFSDGLADTLLHMLAQTPDLRVAARTSSFQFKGQQVDARDVGAQLNVATVLEGSVQRAGDRVRVIVQLIDTETGYHLLSETYDRQLEDIFAVQDEIAGQVAEALLGSLLDEGGGASPSDVGGTDSVAAYEAFMQAAQRMERRTTEDVEAAVELLELATELDPGFGRAWVKLSEAHLRRPIYGTVNFKEAGIASDRAAEKALEVAPDLAEAHLAMATVGPPDERSLPKVRGHIERALELNPNSVDALAWLSELQGAEMQERESLKTLLRAVERDPLDAELRRELVGTYRRLGLEVEAWASLQRAIELEPDSVANQRMLGWAYIDRGDVVAGARIFRELLEENPQQLQLYMFLSRVYAVLGDADTGTAYMKQAWEIQPDRVHDDLADLYLMLGEVDRFREHWTAYRDYLVEIGDADTGRMQRADLQLAMVDEDWPQVAELYGRIAETDQQRGDLYGQLFLKANLAGALHRLGLHEEADAAMAESLALVERAEAGGARLDGLALVRSLDAAHRGDREAAAAHLEGALRTRPVNFIIARLYEVVPPQGFTEWPEVAAVITDLEAEQALALAELHAAFPETAP